MIEYRYLQPEDAEAAAAIHVEGQPGTVLTRLGRSFLTELYRAVCSSEWSEGFGAYDDGRLVGLSAVLVSSKKFFNEFKFRRLWRVTFPVSWSVLRQPQILADVVKGWSYPEQARSPEREVDVLFLGVKREYLRQGLGPELVRRMFAWADVIGVTSANLMIEKRNRAMRWMIGQLHGLYIAHEFELYGRTMVFYKVPIAANQADARLPLGQPYTHAHIYPKTEEVQG